MKPKKDTKKVRVTFFASKVSTGRGSGFWLDTSVAARLVGPPDQNHVGVFGYDLAHYVLARSHTPWPKPMKIQKGPDSVR